MDVPVKYFCLFIYENLKSFPVNTYLYKFNIKITNFKDVRWSSKKLELFRIFDGYNQA